MKTIIWFIKFWCIQVFQQPKYLKYKRLLKNESPEVTKEYLETSISKWGRRMVTLTKSTVEVKGINNVPAENVLFVSNHQGNFDIPIILGYVPKLKGFIAKKELSKIPLVTKWMKAIGCTFLDRGNLRSSIKMLKAAIKQLENGESLVIFPEGTRSQGPTMNEFKKGSLSLAIKSKVPIVPITLNGTYKLLEEKKRINKSHVTITIHPAIYTKDLTREDQKALLDKVYNIIKEG